MSRVRSKRGRAVHGILPLDKPAGLTSNAALQQVKALYQARKAGHTGSLDQLATGMLPICFGEATKLSGFLLDADKHYRVTCQLGVSTNTGDAAGEIVARAPVPALASGQVRAVLAEFTGEIEQVPPMHSALKHQGRRLYQLARAGLEVERRPRPVTIHVLELLELASDRLELEVRCSKGTYIRTLAQDIGARLGCGAHVSGLRRLGAGPFTADQMISMEQLEAARAQGGVEALDKLLFPMDAALANKPRVELAEPVAFYLRQGQPVLVPHAPTRGRLRLYDDRGRFLGVGEVLDDGRIAPRRLLRGV
jgi:tRNA pseudouridine55 synthase